jgi:hypothetical protein
MLVCVQLEWLQVGVMGWLCIKCLFMLLMYRPAHSCLSIKLSGAGWI